MSKIVKPVALDETLQSTNTKLDTLKTGIDAKADVIKTAIDQQKTAIQTAIDQQKTTIDTDIRTLADSLIGVLASVKSVNGKYGVVVLDSGDILISKSGGKTIRETVSDMQTAISKTPMTIVASEISMSVDDYLASITTGTPT